MSNTNQYWASLEPKETVAECNNRRKDFYKYCNDKGFMFLWACVYQMYHSATANGPLSSSVGEWNELQQVNINNLRNLLQHKVGIVISQRPTWEPMATNDDADTLTQTILSKNLLNYYTEVQGYDKKMSRCANGAAKFAECFVVQTWDASQGKTVAKLPDAEGNATTIKEGDLDCRVVETVDVIRDCSIAEHDQNHWYIIRQEKNKWDIAAKYPAQYDEIVACALEHEINEHYLTFTGEEKSKDLIYVYTLFHKPTAALPGGREISYINEDIILFAQPMLYPDFPLHRMVDVPIAGTNFSYTDAFDMLAPADLLNGLWSTVVTNQRAFGVQNIIMPIGANISESQIGGQLNVIEYDAMSGGKPEPLNLLATPPEIFNSIGLLTNVLNTLSGVNSTAQGNPPTGVTSGTALSMLQSLNVQYNQGLQESFINTMTSVGTALINILKQNARTERVAQIVGSSKKAMAQKFTGKDLSSIQRVIARPGNPMMQTTQGRYSVAEMITKNGLDAAGSNMLLTVLETGSLDALTDTKELSNINIKSENEMLRNGIEVPVRVTDDHVAHIREHAQITSDPQMRTAKLNSQNAKVLAMVMAHEAEHIRFLGDPQFAPLLVALGQQPLTLTPGQLGYTPPAAAPTAPVVPGQAPVAPAAPGVANVAANAGAVSAAATAQPGTANGMAAAIPKPAPTTPVGQVPQGLINAAQKKPPQGM